MTDVLLGVLLGWAGGMVVPRLWSRSRAMGHAIGLMWSQRRSG